MEGVRRRAVSIPGQSRSGPSRCRLEGDWTPCTEIRSFDLSQAELGKFWALGRAKLEAGGISAAAIDMLIAAEAIAVGAVLVTRDKIFEQIDDLKATANWVTDL